MGKLGTGEVSVGEISGWGIGCWGNCAGDVALGNWPTTFKNIMG